MSQKSARCTRQSRRASPTLTKPMTATITIAGEHRDRDVGERVGPNTRSGATTSAVTTPVNCVRAPAASMIDERVTAPVTIIPWKSPADALAAPSATSSSSVRHVVVVLARELARERDRLEEPDEGDRERGREQRAHDVPRRAAAPRARRARSARARRRRSRASSRPNARTASDATTTRASAVGSRGRRRAEQEHDDVPPPMASVPQLASSSASPSRRRSRRPRSAAARRSRRAARAGWR